VLTVASLTLRETQRRRIASIAIVASIVVAALTAWGFGKLDASLTSREGARAAEAALTILIAFMFSVVLAIGGAFVASSTIAGDVESGIILAILPRPIARWAYVVGRWLGLAGAFAVFVALANVLEFGAVVVVTGYRPPHPLRALGFLELQTLATISLALLCATRLPAIASGLIAIVAFGLAWTSGVAGSVATVLHSDAVVAATTMIGLLIPTDVLWRAALFDLQPVVYTVAANAAGSRMTNPFGVSGPPTAASLVWSVLWIASVVAAATISFGGRDI